MTIHRVNNITKGDAGPAPIPSQQNLALRDRFRRAVQTNLSLHDQLLLFATYRATKAAGTKTVQPYQVLGEYLLITRAARIPPLQDPLSPLPALESEGYLSVSPKTGRIKVSQTVLPVDDLVEALSEIDFQKEFVDQMLNLG
jgi:hypothetical protein